MDVELNDRRILASSTDHTNKQVMFKAERDDVVEITEVHQTVVDRPIPDELKITRRDVTYYGVSLEGVSDDVDMYQITCPGPDFELLLWYGDTNDEGYVEEFVKAAEVSAEIGRVTQYDMCPECGEPMKTLRHEREGRTGVCNRSSTTQR